MADQQTKEYKKEIDRMIYSHLKFTWATCRSTIKKVYS
jgi:hypothetical protein